jgi:hypothetical protein
MQMYNKIINTIFKRCEINKIYIVLVTKVPFLRVSQKYSAYPQLKPGVIHGQRLRR